MTEPAPARTHHRWICTECKSKGGWDIEAHEAAVSRRAAQHTVKTGDRTQMETFTGTYAELNAHTAQAQS